MRLRYTIGNILDYCENENKDYRDVLAINKDDTMQIMNAVVEMYKMGTYDKEYTRDELLGFIQTDLNTKIDVYDLYIDCLGRLADAGFFLQGGTEDRERTRVITDTPLEKTLTRMTSIYALLKMQVSEK